MYDLKINFMAAMVSVIECFIDLQHTPL